jgi:N6-L-threonylcarbamoyladenine synthase
MIEEDNFDFSFSGLKTAVLREVQKLKAENNFNNLMVKQLAYEIQEAISDVLVDKTLRALGKNKIKTLLLAGGVAANDRLREKFLEKINDLKTKINFLVPPPKLCTDNAAYISSYAYFNFSPIPWAKVKTDSELSIIS